MRTLRRASIVLIAFAAATSIGCLNAPLVPPVNYVSKAPPIQFTFPSDWSPNTKKHPFDLQCFSRNQDLNTGVFTFRDSDLPEDTTTLDVLRMQIDDIKSKRQNFKELEGVKTREINGKRISTTAFSADASGTMNYYRFTLIEFTDDPTRFAILLQISIPESWEKSGPIFAAIAESATPLPEAAPSVDDSE